MSSFISPKDLEKSERGSTQITKPPDIGLGMFFELSRQTQLLEQLLVETKRVKNKLWNIEDVLSQPHNEPEYQTEPHDLEDK